MRPQYGPLLPSLLDLPPCVNRIGLFEVPQMLLSERFPPAVYCSENSHFFMNTGARIKPVLHPTKHCFASEVYFIGTPRTLYRVNLALRMAASACPANARGNSDFRACSAQKSCRLIF
jgi:hypothetical protein